MFHLRLPTVASSLLIATTSFGLAVGTPVVGHAQQITPSTDIGMIGPAASMPSPTAQSADDLEGLQSGPFDFSVQPDNGSHVTAPSTQDPVTERTDAGWEIDNGGPSIQLVRPFPD
jgi:hypothetical protein